jgi:hypothetical protein
MWLHTYLINGAQHPLLIVCTLCVMSKQLEFKCYTVSISFVTDGQWTEQTGHPIYSRAESQPWLAFGSIDSQRYVRVPCPRRLAEQLPSGSSKLLLLSDAGGDDSPRNPSLPRNTSQCRCQVPVCKHKSSQRVLAENAIAVE